MGDGDYKQLVAADSVENAIRPITDRSTTDTATDWLADTLELEQERKLTLDRINKPAAISAPPLVVVIARFLQLVTSLIADDENACHTSHEARELHLRPE
ncbi:MAG TPA: hypothetical protein VNN08_12905 [Thermoanaerobaculia bacterium]|nr:hypothetical protein [Thermoanaerobaculia bacterium]